MRTTRELSLTYLDPAVVHVLGGRAMLGEFMWWILGGGLDGDRQLITT